MKRVAVADPDGLIAGWLHRELNTEGFEVEWFAASEPFLRALRSRTFDLVFVAIDGDFDGVELCSRVRAEALRPDVPIIAVAGEASDHPDALLAGADESVLRAFSVRELLARTRALLRRAQSAPVQPAAYSDQVVEIFPEAMRVVRAGQSIDLSRGESAVLDLLIRHAPAALSVERIRLELAEPVTRSAIEARLKSLRRKIGRELIANRPGYGYSFAARNPRHAQPD